MNIGMNKKMLDAAVRAANQNNYVDIDDPSIVNDLSDMNNPELILLEKEKKQITNKAYTQLSDEAKQLINIIFNAPMEIFDLIYCPKTKNVRKNSKYRIYFMLKKQWKEQKAAKYVIKELENFVKTF
ncbi:hypothetical protein KKF82_08350 [Patescibacteria group bacterium]|uniref:Uncharacterized protein n=1 Tax=viral metagenome TaxID=1070528 RepID=A0A6M3M226_9ZZZZ|nr:hypothetical protein [Patescibacteria group bacterium]